MNSVQIFIYLTVCALKSEKATLAAVKFEELWNLASAHNMTALIGKALFDTEAYQKADKAEQKRWSEAVNQSIKKTILFDAERKRITAFLEENGIWYMPLKGAVINGLYKNYGTREFADNDILFDNNYREAVRDYMLRIGYTLRSDVTCADEYSKEPLYNFEMHRSLYDEDKKLKGFDIYTYYRNVKSKLVKDEGSGYGYHFTDNDFYIFFIIHAFKHYSISGTGLRTVSDEYVILQKYTDIDFDVVESELKKMGADDFEKNLRTMTQKLFSDKNIIENEFEALSDEEKKLLFYIISSGTFGISEHYYQNMLEEFSAGNKTSHFTYYKQRLSRYAAQVKHQKPSVAKHKILFSFYLMYRIPAQVIKKRKSIKQEMEYVKSLTKNEE